MNAQQMELVNKLRNVLGEENVLIDEPLKKYSYTKTGGNAAIMLFPTSVEALVFTIKLCNQLQLEKVILGNGSNVIISDKGVNEVVIMTERMQGIEKTSDTTVYVNSGNKLADFTVELAEMGLTGMEFACGIPGTVGGAVFMNAGAYGGEMKDVLKSVTAITPEGLLLRYPKEELKLSYRKSAFQHNGMFIVGAEVELAKGEKEAIKSEMERLNQMRSDKQPLEYPSCGSVFKRPIGHYAGQLIQEAGLQGKMIGGVQVSTKHAGFMVNVENGTAQDYQDLIKYVQENVYNTSGIMLEPEVKIIGG